MTTFLCWNLNKKPLQQLIANIATSRDVDVVILLECHISVATLLQTLNQPGEQIFQYAKAYADIQGEAPTRPIKILTRFHPDFLESLEDGRGLTIRHLRPPLRTEAILVVGHLRSKLHRRDTSQMFDCADLANTIARTESRIGHSRTILVGDFNMNPFEDGMVAARGLNATMLRRQAMKAFREIQDNKYLFFYNPMWGHFGDGEHKPPGTYYYHGSDDAM